MMDLGAEIEAVLAAVEAPFDKHLWDKGRPLELTLNPDQVAMLEELERVHLDCRGAMGGEAFRLGFELGKVFGKRLSVNPEE